MTGADENWLQRVRLSAANPLPWWIQARTLRQAAEDLWHAGNEHARSPGSELNTTVLHAVRNPEWSPPNTGGSTSSVCFMLFGFALENLTKGIIVCRDPSRVTKIGFKGWHRKGHKLLELFELAMIPLDEQERKLLGRVTRLTEWKGRYPLPMTFDKVTPHEPLLGYIALSESWPEDDYNALCALYDKARAIFDESTLAIPPLPEDYQFDAT